MADLATAPAEESVEDRVLRIVVDVLAAEPERSVPEAYLIQDLGADSLDLVELEFELEEAFALQFTTAESHRLERHCFTIADVARLVRGMLADRAVAAEGR